MSKQIWFKRKLYGWGWTPVTWQGWAILAVYICFLIILSIRIENLNYTESESITMFLFPVFVLTAVLIAVCYKHGEKPRWQWGKDLGDK